METTGSNGKGSSSLSLRGIIEVFYKPAEFFKELKENPKLLVPYAVLFVLTLVMMFLLSDLIVKMQLESPELQERLKGAEMPPEGLIFMKYSIIIGGAIAIIIIPLLTGLLAWFFGNFVMAGKASYKQILSTMIYSEILFILGSFIVVPMALAKGSMTADISLGFLAAEQGMQSITYLALSKISLFHIWEIIVAGIGLATIYDFPRNKGYVLAVLSIGLLSILHVGFSAIGLMFG